MMTKYLGADQVICGDGLSCTNHRQAHPDIAKASRNAVNGSVYSLVGEPKDSHQPTPKPSPAPGSPTHKRPSSHLFHAVLPDAAGRLMLARAKRRVELMDFIMLTDRFAESMELLSYALKGPPLDAFCSCNINFAKPKYFLSQEVGLECGG